MPKSLKVLTVLIISTLLFLPDLPACRAEAQGFKKGVAHGTFMMQGYSSLEAPGTLRFFAEGAQAAESSLSYVDDAYISLDEGDREGNPYELKGTFSGGPNGVASFVNSEGLAFSVPLKDGRTFDLSIPGVQVHMTVTDPSIFELDEDEKPLEYDPDAPLTDSGVRISDIDGQAEIACPPNFDAWDVLKKNMVIYNHCHLKTGEDSTIELSMQAGPFKIRAESEVVINESKKEVTKIQLIMGNIWTNVKKMVKGEEFGIKGSQAVAGIKGTTLVMEETGEKTTLKVIEGEVTLTDNAGKSEQVGGGETLSADPKGLGTKTQFDVEKENTSWQTAPVAEPENSPAESKTAENKISSNKTSDFNYAFWIALLAAVIGGAWMMRKRGEK